MPASDGPPAGALRCPFCGAPESERFELDGTRFVVFPCQFTWEGEPGLSEEALADRLRAEAEEGGPSYFRRTCDRLHLFVTKGEGARELQPAGEGDGSPSSR